MYHYLFVGGSAPSNQHDVEPGEAADGKEDEGDDAHDDHGDDRDDRGELVLVVEDVNEAEDEDPDHVNSKRDEKHEEVSVVPPPDTVVDPGAVVVEDLDAVVADAAVRATGRSVELTRDAPLHTDLEQGQTQSQPLRPWMYILPNTLKIRYKID